MVVLSLEVEGPSIIEKLEVGGVYWELAFTCQDGGLIVIFQPKSIPKPCCFQKINT